MAQTKQKQAARTQASRNGSNARAQTRSKGQSSAKRSANGRRPNGTPAPRSRSRRRGGSSGLKGRATDFASSVKSSGENAGSAVAKGVGNAKTPLIAGSAALAGLAGGAVLARGKAGSKLSRLSMPSVTPRSSTAKALGMAAKEVGKAGYQIGQLTSEVRRVREAMKHS